MFSQHNIQLVHELLHTGFQLCSPHLMGNFEGGGLGRPKEDATEKQMGSICGCESTITLVIWSFNLSKSFPSVIKRR